MNKLKVGLTAKTTLVASSHAGEMSESGSASLNYSGLNTTSGNHGLWVTVLFSWWRSR